MTIAPTFLSIFHYQLIFLPKLGHILQSLTLCLRNQLPYKDSCKDTDNTIQTVGEPITHTIGKWYERCRNNPVENPLESYSDSYSSTTDGIREHLGKYTEAVTYLEKFSTKGDAMVSPTATAALANAYAQTGNVDKAISTLKKAADMADSKADDVNNSISPTFLLQAGKLLESQKKNDEALKIYQDIKKKYVNSSLVQSSEIDKYIERVSE